MRSRRISRQQPREDSFCNNCPRRPLAALYLAEKERNHMNTEAKTRATFNPDSLPNAVYMDNDPSRLLIRPEPTEGAVNAMCKDCARYRADCTGTTCAVWTGCVRRVKPARGTYTAKICGKWYALKMDDFARFVFGIGSDADKWTEIEPSPGSTAGRNAAIVATCTPFCTWREAYDAAKAAGNFIGQLCE